MCCLSFFQNVVFESLRQLNGQESQTTNWSSASDKWSKTSYGISSPLITLQNQQVKHYIVLNFFIILSIKTSLSKEVISFTTSLISFETSLT